MQGTEMLDKLSKDELIRIISKVLISKSTDNVNDEDTSKEINNDNDNDGAREKKAEEEENKHSELPASNPQPEIPSVVEPQSIEHISFIIPIDDIVAKLNEVQDLTSILGNQGKKLKSFNNSLLVSLNNFINDLISEKDKINNEFIKSLETITKIFSITSKFSPIESINESVLTPAIRKMILDYNSNIFNNIQDYCNESENLSMSVLNNDIDENLIRLIPVLSQQLLNFNKQLKKFYNLYDLVDDYTFSDPTFKDNLPTREDMNLFNEINKATDIKQILQTNFNKINPSLIDQLDIEIKNLHNYVNSKISELKNIIKSVVKLNHELFKQSEKEYMNLPNFLNDNDLIILRIGIKSTAFNDYKLIYDDLNCLKNERETLLNSYLAKVEQLWSILRPNSNEIQNFLKSNKNLFTSSLNNFEKLLNELEVEKVSNIKKFIKTSREKINGYWNILMYDDESKLKFSDYYILDDRLFDEELLNSHTFELARLRNECESMKPLLNLISKLNSLIDERKILLESTKDSKRLLQKNSFQILREEERIRNKLNKQLPQVINELRVNIIKFENDNDRIFQLNGVPYIETLKEIEESLLPKKRVRSTFNSPRPILVTSSAPIRDSNRSNDRSTGRVTKPKKLVTPSRSVIRKRNLEEISNPFISRDPTPSKDKHLTPVSSANLSSTPQSHLLSTKPVVIRGKSPSKSLDLTASTKTISNQHPLSSPNLTNSLTKNSKTLTPKTRTPMGLLSSSNLNRSHNPNNIPKLNILSIPVEELSDSMLDYSDAEIDNQRNPGNELQKENVSPSHFTATILNKTSGAISSLQKQQHQIPKVQTTQQFNLSLDSETF